MIRTCLLTAVLALSATPAFAALSDCSEPIPPQAVDGATATEQQMNDAHKYVTNFIGDSDTYQVCLNSQFIAMQKEQAKSKDKPPLDPSIQADVSAKLAKNQALKEKVGKEYNDAVVAYKAKHP